MDPLLHGFWMAVCGKLYIFGKSLVNWEQNNAMCCRLGMKPIAFDTGAEFDCFLSLVKDGSWKYNTIYWVNAVRSSMSVNSAYQWCSNNNKVSDAYWSNNEPNYVKGSENCVQMNVLPPKVKLRDQPCGVLTPFICQYADAYDACCAIGLKLLSLHQDILYAFLAEAFQNASISASSKFWTSGTDSGCKGTYGYCGSNRLLREEAIWASGQPDLKDGGCLVVSGDGTLSDERCNSKFQYICEGRVPSKNFMDIIEIECAKTYRLTRNDVKMLMNSTPDELREKCFLKCFGEGTGLFVNGKLAEEKLMYNFQQISQSDVNKLMDMYSTMDFCTSATKGMDPCDKATALLKCGQENSPDAFGDLLNSLETSISEPAVILPPQQSVCKPKVDCDVDENRRNAFLNAPTIWIENGNLKLQKSIACGKNFLAMYLVFKVSYNWAREICCDFGLRIATVDTKQKYDCMISNKITSGIAASDIFAVGATRMGFLQKPIWCHSNTPFDFKLGEDNLSNNPNDSEYVIFFNFKKASMTAGNNAFKPIICEDF
ncbi:uncharacterized protein LOC135940537 [Cloeon dipterum]|uniref:uncharacterized protein LOC135940537 n=1 Tax=Cloeon dipterum TaxID=197152 RepID=UPI00321FD8BE